MVQLLTADNKLVRLERCRLLLRRVTTLTWEQILFTDVKLFAIEQAHNRQNDKSWCAEGPGTSAIVEHCPNTKSLMVGAGICATGKTRLGFVYEGVKIYIFFTAVTSWTPWRCLGHLATLANSNITFNKIPLQPTERKCRRSCAMPILPTSSHFRNGRSTGWIVTLRITAYGKFWRPGTVISCTKIRGLLQRGCYRLSADELQRATAFNFRKRLTLCIEAKGGEFVAN